MFLICSYFNRDRDRTTAINIEAKDQDAAAGLQTPGAFLPTTGEINPFVIPSNRTPFHVNSKEKLPLQNSNIRPTAPTTVDPHQAELKRRIQELQQEMTLLQPRNSLSSQRPSSSTEGTDDWRSNLELLRAEVRRLRLAMHFQSSQDSSDQPPDYVHIVRDETTSSSGPSHNKQ